MASCQWPVASYICAGCDFRYPLDNPAASIRITMNFRTPLHSILRGCDLLRTRPICEGGLAGHGALATGY
jgi:hypothetical protein